MDFWGALKRAFTLPKSKNSISDILGDDYADIFRARLIPLADDVAGQVFDVLSKGLITTFGLVDRVKRDFIFYLEGEIGHSLSEKVEAEIDRALQDALKKLPTDSEELQRAIRDALLKALKL